MWLRHETALAHAIAETTGAPADDPYCAALAHFVLEAAADRLRGTVNWPLSFPPTSGSFSVGAPMNVPSLPHWVWTNTNCRKRRAPRK